MTPKTKCSWSPQRALVFIVGVLEWKWIEIQSFPKLNRRDEQLFEYFKTMGVPDGRLAYLSDQNATLKNIKKKFNDLLEISRPGDTLFFYYCGHGSSDPDGNGYYLAYDYGMRAGALRAKYIVSNLKKRFRGRNAMFFADCCSSGAIASALAKTNLQFDYAVLTSTFPGNESTGNWTFSQSLLDAFWGYSFVDSDKDGMINFEDLVKHASFELWSIDQQHLLVYSTKKIQKNFVMTPVRKKFHSAPKLVEVKWKNKWWKAKLSKKRKEEGRIRWCQIGWDAKEDECWYPLSRIREIPFNSSLGVRKGSRVLVFWGNKYYKACVLRADRGRYLVHYEGFESVWDEWVDSSRIQ